MEALPKERPARLHFKTRSGLGAIRGGRGRGVVVSLNILYDGMSSVQVKWKGKSLELITVTAEMTVAQLKASLEEMTGVPSKNQKLLFRGAMLKDDDASVSGLNFKEVMP